MKRHPRYYHWQIAYKLKSEDTYHLIPNPKYAWAADPFLVEYKGHIYLFAELFLYKSERNGVIGYCEYTEGGFSDWKISMDEHWHLSYPNVFVKDEKLLMCPETYQKNEVSIYELVDFPNNWKLIKMIINNKKLVDTTFLSIDDENYMFSFEPTFKGDNGSLVIYKTDEDNRILEGKVITDDRLVARPAGNFINKDGKLYRVCQISENSYGEGINITEVESVWPEYKEKIVKTIYPFDIKIDSSIKFEGIHTYNSLGDLEVIDLKFYNPSLTEYFASRRTKKVFTNKY